LIDRLDTVVVVTSGSAWAGVPAGAVVVAADAGAEVAFAAGVGVDLAVGDFDSLSVETLGRLERSGAQVVRHPVAKDATDLELALDAAVGLLPARVLVLAGAGGRLDHLLSILLVLGLEKYAAVELEATVGEARVHVVRAERTLVGNAGETISLFALHGDAVGVRTRGLVYPLRGEVLVAGSSRGCSNVFADAEVSIEVAAGVVLAVRPGSGRGESAS
jgi:thiamine pyrophosphokinase